jgi:hypothetical protein
VPCAGRPELLRRLTVQRGVNRRHHRLEGPEATTVKRRLNDGREFRIVKVFYRPDELAARLADLGWQVEVQATPSYFLHGCCGIARRGNG